MAKKTPPVEAPKDYSLLRPQLINFYVQYYNVHGTVLTAEQAHAEFNIPLDLVKYALQDTEFKEALEEQGITFRESKNEWLNKGLTASQLMVANALLDLTDTRSEKKKLQDLGISTLQYQTWLKDLVFKEYLHTRAEQLMGESKHEVSQALRDRIKAGDLKAIAYYNEMMGIYVQPRSNSYGVNGQDVHQIIVQIIEIVDEVVTDAEQKLAISEKLKALITRRNLANGLVGADTQMGGMGPNPVVAGNVVQELTI